MHVKDIPFDSESSVYAPPHVDHEIPEDGQTLWWTTSSNNPGQ